MSFITEDEKEKVKAEMEVPRDSKILPQYPDPIIAVLYGAKGTIKTSIAYAFGDGEAIFAVICLDGSAENVRNSVVDEEIWGNYHIFKIGHMIDKIKLKNDPKTAPKDYEKVYNYVMNELLKKKIPALKPNVVLFDGAQEWEETCRGAMKAEHGLTLLGGTPIDKWQTRNWKMDTSLAAAKQATQDMVMYAMHEYKKPYLDIKGEYKDNPQDMPEFMPEPQWSSDVKEKSHIMTYHVREEGFVGAKYVVKVQHNKMTGKEGVVDDAHDNPFAVWDFIFKGKREPLIKRRKKSTSDNN